MEVSCKDPNSSPNSASGASPLSFVPAFALYLVLQAYMYIVNLRFLADVVLFAGIIAVTAVLMVLFTKIRIAWWLRRWKFAFARTLIVLGSLGASLFAGIYNLAHFAPR